MGPEIGTVFEDQMLNTVHQFGYSTSAGTAGEWASAGLEDWGLEFWRTGGLGDWNSGGLDDWTTGALANWSMGYWSSGGLGTGRA